MRKLLALVLITLISYGGYTFYRQYQAGTRLAIHNVSLPANFNIKNQAGSLDNLQAVLGASISNAVETSKDWMSEATNGASEPIVNRAINNFQTELQSLPEQQVEKIKYDFCKPIVTAYEKKGEE